MEPEMMVSPISYATPDGEKMTFEKPRVTFDLKTPMEDHYHATISNMTSLECIHWIRKKLTPQQQQMFRSTCFGHFLDMRELTFPSQLVHNILLREVETVGLPDEMWFLVSGKAIRFSAYEFGLVTGLKFDKVPTVELPSEKNRLRDTYFDGQTLQLKDFRERILHMDLSGIPDLDVVKLALYFVLERLLMGRDRRRYINLLWLRMVDYLDTFNAYPWGVESYEMTITSMSDALRGRTDRFKQRQTVKKGTHVGERYNLTGCPYAVQVWLCEAIPFVAKAYGESGKQFSDKIPRMLKWMTTRVPTEVEVRRDVFQVRKDHPRVILDPTPAERATSWYMALERHMGARRGLHVQWALRESLPLAAYEIEKAQGVAVKQEVPLVDLKLKASKPKDKKKEPIYSTAKSTTTLQGDPETQQGDDETQPYDDVGLPDTTSTILGQMASHFTHVTRLLESQSKEMKGMLAEMKGMHAEMKGMRVEINALQAEVRDLKAQFDEADDMDAEFSQLNPKAHDPHSMSYPSAFQESQAGNSSNDSLQLEKSYSKGRKRMKIPTDAENCSNMSSSRNIKNETKRQKTKVSWNIINYSDPFGISDMQNLDFDRFGSVAKDIKDLMDLQVRTWGPLFTNNPLLLKKFVDAEKKLSKQDSELANQDYVIDLEDDCVAVDVPFLLLPNDKDEGARRPSYPVHEASAAGQFLTKDTMVGSLAERTIQTEEKDSLAGEPEIIIQMEGKESSASEADRTVQMEGEECLASEAERTTQMEEEENLATGAERTLKMEGKECLAGEAKRTIQMEEEESLALKQKEESKCKKEKA